MIRHIRIGMAMLALAVPASAFLMVAPPSPDQAAARVDAIAEIEVVAVEAAGPERDGLVRVKVVKQAGIVKLPDHLHVVLPATGPVVGVGGGGPVAGPAIGRLNPRFRRGNPYGLAGVEVGNKLTVSITKGSPWNIERTHGEADWKKIETAFASRKEVAALTPEAIAKRLPAMLKSGNPAQMQAAVAALPAEPPRECVDALRGMDLEAFHRNIGNRFDPPIRNLMVATVQGLPVKDLVARTGARVGISSTIAREALVAKAEAGDAEAIAHWVAQLKNSRIPMEWQYAARALLGKADRKDVREAIIQRLTALTVREYATPELTVALVRGSPEGLAWVLDVLNGKVKLNPAPGNRPRIESWTGSAIAKGDAAALRPLLASADAPVRAFGAAALGALRDAPSAPALAALYDKANEDPIVRGAAAFALMRIGGTPAMDWCRKVFASATVLLPFPPEFESRMTYAVQNDVRLQAVKYLADLGTPEAIALLRKHITELADAKADDQAAGNNNGGVIVAGGGVIAGNGRVAIVGGDGIAFAPAPPAAQAISQLAHGKADAVTALLVEFVRSGKPALADPSVEALLGRRSASTAKLLIDSLGTLPLRQRTHILKTLAAEPATADAVIAHYVKLSAPPVRTPAVLARIKAAVTALGHDDFQTRENAAASLAEIGAAAKPELEAAVTGSDAERASRAKLLLDTLSQASQSGPAATALLVAGTKQHAPLMVSLLGDVDAATRGLALEALVRVFGKDHGFNPLGSEADRKTAQAAWAAAVK